MFQKSFALFFHESEEKQFSQFVMENIEMQKGAHVMLLTKIKC